MKLYKDGITRNTDNPAIAADLLKAGYKKVEEKAAEPKPAADKDEKSSEKVVKNATSN